MVPMHLGLIDGPFVPHNLISTQESPVPLLKIQMAPRLKILMVSVSKNRTQIYFSFLSKVPANEAPGVPQQGPYGEGGVFTGNFAYVSKTSSFGFSSKGALPQGPLDGIPQRERDAPPLEPSSIHLSKSPVYEPPTPHTRFPSDSPTHYSSYYTAHIDIFKMINF
jgi:hypothetical protein